MRFISLLLFLLIPTMLLAQTPMPLEISTVPVVEFTASLPDGYSSGTYVLSTTEDLNTGWRVVGSVPANGQKFYYLETDKSTQAKFYTVTAIFTHTFTNTTEKTVLSSPFIYLNGTDYPASVELSGFKNSFSYLNGTWSHSTNTLVNGSFVPTYSRLEPNNDPGYREVGRLASFNGRWYVRLLDKENGEFKFIQHPSKKQTMPPKLDWPYTTMGWISVSYIEPTGTPPFPQ
jgi:hypothetical protein